MTELQKKSNAGRKPLDDKKQVVTLFIAASVINTAGGSDAIKEHLYKLLNNYPLVFFSNK